MRSAGSEHSEVPQRLFRLKLLHMTESAKRADRATAQDPQYCGEVTQDRHWRDARMSWGRPKCCTNNLRSCPDRAEWQVVHSEQRSEQSIQAVLKAVGTREGARSHRGGEER